jgi:hypothetical protein
LLLVELPLELHVRADLLDLLRSEPAAVILNANDKVAIPRGTCEKNFSAGFGEFEGVV